MADDKNKKEKKHFFKDFKAELKKVSWLTPKQLAKNTMAVVVMVIIVAIIVFVLDLAFETLNSQGIDRLRKMVQNNNVVASNTIDNTVDDILDNTLEDSNLVNEANNIVE